MSPRRGLQVVIAAVTVFALGGVLVMGGVIVSSPPIIALGAMLVAGEILALVGIVILLHRRVIHLLSEFIKPIGAVRGDLDRLKRLLGSEPGSLEARLRHLGIRDTEALLTLHHALPRDREGVPLTSYSALPSTALLLTEYVRELPTGSLVVELGSGATTLWAALAVQHRGGDVRIVSLESSPEWAAVTRAALERHGVEHLVDLRTAELVPLATGEGEQVWYDPDGWADLERIDLLFIDGPPGTTGRLARFPAVEALGPRLAPGAIVVMDDADRDDEREIVQRWRARDLPGGRPVDLESRERTVSLRLE